MNRNTRRKHKLRAALAEARREVRILLEGGPAADALRMRYEFRDKFERSAADVMWAGKYRTDDDNLTGGLYSQMMGTPAIIIGKP